MPLPDAIAAAEAYRAALLRNERASATRLVNAYGQVYARLQATIEALDTEVYLLQQTGAITEAKLARLDRLRSLSTQIEEQVTRFAVYADTEIHDGARSALAQAMTDAERMVQARLPGLAPLDRAIMGTWQRLDPQAFESLLGFLADDSPLFAGMRERMGAAIAARVSEALVQGLALGYNPRKVARIVSKEMGGGLDSALRISRTAQLMAYREGIRASWLANPRIVKGWEWHATRDARTCMSCIAMDGTIHPLAEKMSDHWNGRCVALAVLPTYREMGFDVDQPAEQRQSAESWFRAQPEAAQRAQMGKGKYQAWRAGHFGIPDLTVETTDPVWGKMRTERALKDLMPAETAA